MADIIPIDILATKVLSRLPLKTLLRFKCVCKRWFFFISHDPYFRKLHLNRIGCGENTKLIIKNTVPPYNFYLMEYENSSSSSSEEEEEEEEEGKNFEIIEVMESPTTSNIRLCGSCDGLILLAEYNNFILWNPYIEAYREIPTHPEINRTSLICGICYDSLAHDYKVLIVSSFEKYRGYNYGYAVFSLKSGRWTKFKEFPYDVDFRKKGVMVNGALHWIVEPFEFSSCSCKFRGVIVYYDVVMHEFKQVSGPDQLNGRMGLDLANLRGCLCIFECRNRSFYELMVWEMKQYGVKESWTPLFEVSLADRFTMRPLCFNKKGEVVMQCNYGSIRVYNTETKKFTLLKDFRSVVIADTYIESLVSVNGI